ncbi:MAG TPA: glycoside hydrolase family 43 protein [Acidimicrobiales bacterium]|nr:glycoside hydrolase family 43 protein [Acidimicrobiales bacterium]
MSAALDTAVEPHASRGDPARVGPVEDMDDPIQGSPEVGVRRSGGRGAGFEAAGALLAVLLSLGVVGAGAAVVDHRSAPAIHDPAISRRAVPLPAPVAVPVAPVRLFEPALIVTPFANAPDPFVLVVGHEYLLFSSETSLRSPAIALRVSGDPDFWTGPVTDPLPVLPRWAAGGATWAPDVRFVDHRYVMWFTALLGGSNPPMECIGDATSTDPIGPYHPLPRPLECQLGQRGSIDSRTFVDRSGHLWMDWKNDENADVNGTSHTTIYAERLSSDGLALVGHPVAILRANQPWEGRIVEAPDMVRADGHDWLFYSGNWFNQPTYALGVAECAGPAGPCTKPLDGPWLASNFEGAGPGECSIFAGPGRWWMVYSPLSVRYRTFTPRPVALLHLGFSADGPYVIAPVEPGAPRSTTVDAVPFAGHRLPPP